MSDVVAYSLFFILCNVAGGLCLYYYEGLAWQHAVMTAFIVVSIAAMIFGKDF